MVLGRLGLVAALGLAAGCGQSLFDASGERDAGGGGGGGGGGGDVDGGPVPADCPSGCLGDAAGDFDGSPSGTSGRWRYLDDPRDRSWTAMTGAGQTLTGAGDNRITTCAASPDATACAELPGALLVTSTGATSAADPALEFTAPDDQIIQISVRAVVPAGATPQAIRLYRNSREDVLFTEVASAEAPLARALTLDALAGDRLLVAVAPAAGGAADVGLQIFVNATGAVFPADCQVALRFAEAASGAASNACGTEFAREDYEAGAEPETHGAGPFAELGQAADLAPNDYYKASTLIDHGGDVTVQLWARLDALVDPYAAWMFADYDLNLGGGLGIALYENNGGVLTIEAGVALNGDLEFADAVGPYPADGAWHFVRFVHRGDAIELCVDGERVAQATLPAGFDMASGFPPHVGRNVVWLPQGAFWDGGIDDVRVFSGALPCD